MKETDRRWLNTGRIHTVYTISLESLVGEGLKRNNMQYKNSRETDFLDVNIRDHIYRPITSNSLN